LRWYRDRDKTLRPGAALSFLTCKDKTRDNVRKQGVYEKKIEKLIIPRYWDSNGCHQKVWMYKDIFIST
jgi:hypothetical protein